MNEHFAISLPVGSSLANHTGAWRTERPNYIDRLPPCNHACPAGENTQGWLYHAEEGNFRAAWEEIMRNNPFPAIMGRACYHPCETSCNRAQLDEPVSIHAVERFLGDRAIEEGWNVEATTKPNGKHVLVVGAGPSGLSAAYHLARLGHAVTIVEAGPAAGGMMRFGIPAYRLPRNIIDAEVQRILNLGVTLRLNEKVEDIPALMQREKFDACFVAIGAHVSKHVDIPSPDAGRVLDALSMLRSPGEAQVGRKVVVYGGGNTALDVARTARRLGDEAIIVYRRTREKMPAHDFEVEEAIEEGIQFRWLETIKHMNDESITVEKMALDADGYPQPTGEFEVISGDMVVLALGQDVDSSILDSIPGIEHNKDGVVKVGANMMTGHAGIFAGGDMVPSERTITVAVGHGKKAARNIDAYLNGVEYKPAQKHALASFEKLNTWYYSDAEQTVQPVLAMLRRRSTFEEVVSGLDEQTALFEARRCMSCGNCFECDNCFAVCPDNSVIKLPKSIPSSLAQGEGFSSTPKFKFNYDYCKGCGICVAECPAGAIEMVAEDI
ncbi:MAG: NAD(P)-binding protein [Bacteroidota bacterium]|nr:NAD(P)-binding protein [Bacteroidota bacterium]MDP4232989.1 NAD(P)-binding protein [Bacteroidota bacterium]MDP4242033.1 NAD(P)-binding protein [Bacteroidota bacterium]MDP4286936.1 NAD(P)-binding protein [Bacteroidota bacterium]